MKNKQNKNLIVAIGLGVLFIGAVALGYIIGVDIWG